MSSILWTGDVLHLRGEHDLATAPGFREAVDAVLMLGWNQLTIDMSECSFVDSTILGVLIHAAREMDVTVRKPSPAVRRALEMIRLELVLNVED